MRRSRVPARAVMAAALIAAGLAPGASAQAPPKPALTLAGARGIIAAVEAEAARNGWPCVVAVVDAGGWLIAQARMDASPMLVSVDLAAGKAKSAVLYAKPTLDLEKAIDSGRVAAVTAGFVQMRGGIPLEADGHLVGAVGVSSALPDHDQILAEAGRDAFKTGRRP